MARVVVLMMFRLASHGNGIPALYGLEQRAGHREIHGGPDGDAAKGWNSIQARRRLEV